jgi:hypothetical protein
LKQLTPKVITDDMFTVVNFVKSLK